jgi:hypothetical protein
MASRRVPHSKVSVRYPVLRSFLCLWALLPYFLLPAVFYSHLTVGLPPGAFVLCELESAVIKAHPQQPFCPEDSQNCPICRAASSFEDYGCGDLPLAPAAAARFLGLALTNGDHLVSHCDFWVSESRAPPLFL